MVLAETTPPPGRALSRRDPVERIRAFNAGRDPIRLRLKYQKLADHPFAFFRGTAHLFHADWPKELAAGPPSWACGDLHFENFGSFKGANGLTYYDVSDFDEAVLSGPWLDPARYLVSLFVALGARDGLALGRCFLESYRLALRSGTPGWVERATARGLVRDLLQQVKHRRRRDLLAAHVEGDGGRARIAIREGHTLPAPRSEAREVEEWLARPAPKDRAAHRSFQVVDVARRIVGTGSLGVARWMILARRQGGPDRLELLDLKESLASAAEPYASCAQPRWPSQAARVVGIQRRMQASAPRFLQPITIGRRSFVLRTFQPRADKVTLNGKTTGGQHERLVRTSAQIAAWNQLRGSGRDGSASADSLIEWAREKKWAAGMLAFARDYRAQVIRDWEAFREDFRKR